MYSLLIAAAAEETHEVVNELPIPPAAVGILAMSVFVLLLLITFAFRSVGTRHR
jgi:hypothetical protein